MTVAPPEKLLAAIANAGITASAFGEEDVHRLPDEKGAYLLLVGLHDSVALKTGRSSARILEAGWYVYAGSAYGPGGIRARVARHFKAQKPLHWHIDYLTGENHIHAMGLPDQQECNLVSRLLKTGLFEPAIKNFGNSDCRVCESHLLMQIF